MLGTADALTNRYIVISTDGHCGADLLDYKPYLESRFHDDFDNWASTYHDGWGELDTNIDPEDRMGFASYDAPLNWESERRIEVTEVQGIAAELLFPNTSPPFYPSGALTAPGPRTEEEYDRRFAGVRAHNRWLAEFCADAPGRRGGMAQIFLDNVDDAIAEVQRAKEAGLMGVLLPMDHVLKLANLYNASYDRLWAVCAELELPIHQHAGVATESAEEAGSGAPLVATAEFAFYGLRGVWHLIAAGVFERYPTLKYVMTELAVGSEIPAYLARLDGLVDYWYRYPNQFTHTVDALAKLSRRPSEYFETNCYVGGPLDLVDSVTNSTPNIMFGADLPHAEGTAPFTVEALRLAFAEVSEERRRRALWLTAADVYGFDVELLQSVADRVGPRVADMTVPLPEEGRPVFPEDTRCHIFSPTFVA